MFQNLLQFEFKYQSKQLAFLLLSILFLVIGLQIGNQGYGRGTTIYNSPQSIAEITGIMTLGSVFIIMFFTINGVLRDSRFRFEPILFSTPLKKRNYFWSMFLGVFVMSTISFSMFLLGFAITTFFPNLDPELVNPFNIMDYLWTLLIIVLPNIFICTAIIFSVSLLSKNNVATYASAILIYALYFLCSLFLNSPLMANSEPLATDSYAMAALMDPFGLSALFEQTMFWTSFEKNSLSISLTGNFLWNRLLWSSIGFIILLSSYGLFSFRKTKSLKRNKAKKKKTKVSVVPYVPVQTMNNWFGSFVNIFKLELTAAVKSLPFIAVTLMWSVIVILEVFARIIEGGAYNDSLYPATYKMIGMFIDPLYILGYILIVFYSGEIIWKERTLEFHGIIDSTPTKNSSFYLGKLITLIVLPFMLIVMAIFMSIIVQLISNYNEFDPMMYLSLFYSPGLTFVFFSLLAIFIQALMPNKYLGMAVTGLLIVFLGTSISSSIGIEHPMLLVGNLPNIQFSGMNGFTGVTKAYNHMAFYWLSFGIILSFLSFQLWKRGSITNLKFRMGLMTSNWGKKTTIFSGVLLMMWICSAVNVYSKLHIETDYISTNELLNLKEVYERNYKQYDSIRGLFPTVMKTKVDLYPSERRYVVKGSYTLKNKSERKLTKYLITEKEPIANISLEGGILVNQDAGLGIFEFEFPEGIEPGEEIKFEFIIDKQLKGFQNSKNIVENGTYIQHRDFEPRLGYSSRLEISNSLERKKRGLPELKIEEISDDHIVNTGTSIGRVHFSTIISTEKGQRALSSGELVKRWNENNRSYFEYDSKGLIMPTMGYFSGIYSNKTANHNGIAIEQYYLPKNDFNIDRIEESTVKTLDYCQKYFGQYPFTHIRLAQIPSHWQFGGFAHPSTISLTEDRNYLVDIRDPRAFDLVAKRTIHEVAHQWFGHILAPKNVEGASIFVEGFAKYTEGRVMEKMHGKSAIWELSRNSNKRYFTYRTYSNETEPPVYQVRGEGYLSYGKLFNVMLATKDLIGEIELNSAIKTILNRHKNQVALKASSVEFLNELYKLTPKKHHQLLDDWFKRVIIYDLKVDGAKVTKIKDGKYQIDIEITSKRVEVQKDGSIKSIGINEPIKVGVFAKHPKKYGLNENPIYYENHQITDSKSALKLFVDELPTHIALDPYGTRNDENYHDNTLKLTTEF